MNENNIMEIIASHQEKINQIEKEIEQAEAMGLAIPDLIIAARTELNYLYDNKARFEMQAKAWGLM